MWIEPHQCLRTRGAAVSTPPPQTKASRPPAATAETAIAFSRTMRQLDGSNGHRREMLSSARRAVSSPEIADAGQRWEASRLALEHRDQIERLSALKNSPRAPGLARQIEMSRPISGEFEQTEQNVRSPPGSPARVTAPPGAAVLPPSGSAEATRLAPRKLGKFISTSELNVADAWKASRAALRTEADNAEDDDDTGWGFGELVG